MEEARLKNTDPRLWFYWLLFCAVALGIIAPHLDLWPHFTQDEVQIIDLGRVFLNPSTDWSVGWLANESTARLGVSYLGAILQELAYRAFDTPSLGSRLSSTLGALLSGAAVLGWLIERKTPWPAAFVLAAAFFLDPIFNDSYRQGRVDSWAFTVIITACWLLQIARRRSEKLENTRWPLTIAGLLAGASVFVWLTSIALLPLVFLEFVYVLRARWKAVEEPKVTHLRPIFLWFVAGGLISVALLLIPIVMHWHVFAASLETGVLVQKAATAIQRNIFDMYLLYDPMILAAFFVALLIRREPGLLIAMLSALAMFYMTMVYPMRILYLLPYFIAIIAGACYEVQRSGVWSRRRISLIAVVGILLFWNTNISLIERPLVALKKQDAQLPDQIFAAMERVIGPGPHRVLVEEWDIYPAARSLGWKSFKVFGRYPVNQSDRQTFLESMDYVIKRNRFSFLVVKDEELEMYGFKLLSTLNFEKTKTPDIIFGPFRIHPPDNFHGDILIYGKTSKALTL